MNQKLKDRIKYWKEQGLNHDCVRCKGLGHEYQNTLRCGNPCKVTKKIMEKEIAQETKMAIEKLKQGEKIEL